MNNNMNIKIIFLFLLTTGLLVAVPPINIFRPYNILLYPKKYPDSHVQISLADEFSIHTRAFKFNKNDCNVEVKEVANVLQLWKAHQDALVILKNYDPK